MPKDNNNPILHLGNHIQNRVNWGANYPHEPSPHEGPNPVSPAYEIYALHILSRSLVRGAFTRCSHEFEKLFVVAATFFVNEARGKHVLVIVF